MRKVYCFPPIELPKRRKGDADVPPGWTACRGFWYVTEREAIAMMTQKLEPPGLKRDAHRVLYRCPKVQNALNSFGDVELRRCRLCCRRDRIAVHHDCNFDCEIRFDAMAAPRQERVQNFNCFTNRYQKAITVGMMRRGVSCASIASTPLLGMARELIQIGIDAQASIPANHAKLQARDIAIDFSRTSIELEVRRLAAEETEMIVKTYQQGKYANMKVDAGTVVKSHVTHCLVDSPFSRVVPWILEAAENTNWNTQDYEAFILSRIQQVEQQNIHLCSIIHDNLSAQSNAIANVLNALEERPRIIDIPCFNHMVNLAYVHAVDECPTLKQMVARIKRWRKLLRVLGINAPDIPKTRWMYIVELLQMICSLPGLEAALTAHPRVVEFHLGQRETEFPAELIQLHAILNPLHILSKKLETSTTRLADVIPLMRECLAEWQKIKSTLEDDSCFLCVLDCLASNLLARLLSNAYEEALTAFVLSVKGKHELSEYLASLDDTRLEALHRGRFCALIELLNAMTDAPACFHMIEEEIPDGHSKEDEWDSSDTLHSGSETTMPVDTRTSQRRQQVDFYKFAMSCLTLDEKLSFDFLADSGELVMSSLVNHGSDIPDENGGSRYYETALIEWIRCPVDELLRALGKFHPHEDTKLDLLLWEHIMALSATNVTWNAWGPLAALAVRYETAGASEAEVERTFSIQKRIQRQEITNITPEGLTARLVLYGDRDINSIERTVEKTS